MTKRKIPKPYRSWWEHDLHKGQFKGFPYEQVKIPYVIDEREYNPDWGPFLEVATDSIKLIETKGVFRNNTLENKGKYRFIKKFLPKDYELIFVFMYPHKLLPSCSKLKYDGWAEKSGFRWMKESEVLKKVDDGIWTHGPEVTERARREIDAYTPIKKVSFRKPAKVAKPRKRSTKK